MGLESNSRMDGLCQTTISKRNLPCIWFSVSVVVNNYFVSHFLILPGFYHPKLKKKNNVFLLRSETNFFLSNLVYPSDLFEEFEKINRITRLERKKFVSDRSKKTLF